ncbi:MAG: hypothetical protein IJT14_04010 [Rickettsiales bacterium]|nr:hypothetical protein [Rickettsiales bacterium]
MEYEIEKNDLNKDTLPKCDANIFNEEYLKEIEAKIEVLTKELSKQELKYQEAELEYLGNFGPFDGKKNINKLYKNTSLIDLSTECTYGSSEEVEEDDKEETPEDSDITPMDADEERPPNSIRKTTQEPQDSINREIDACETEREILLLEEKEVKNLLRKLKNEKYYTNIEIINEEKEEDKSEIHEEKEEDESDEKEREQGSQDNIRNKDTDDELKDTVKEEPSANMRNKKTDYMQMDTDENKVDETTDKTYKRKDNYDYNSSLQKNVYGKEVYKIQQQDNSTIEKEPMDNMKRKNTKKRRAI